MDSVLVDVLHRGRRSLGDLGCSLHHALQAFVARDRTTQLNYVVMGQDRLNNAAVEVAE